jgi:imidazolonepropionase-like amidohydrolase
MDIYRLIPTILKILPGRCCPNNQALIFIKRTKLPDKQRNGAERKMDTRKTNFVKDYMPGGQDRVELKNCRILDVVNGRYYDDGTTVILYEGKIEAMPVGNGESNGFIPDFTIDLQGKTVMPSLYNTHCHLAAAQPTMIQGLRDQKRIKRLMRQQKEKDMAECLAHGITHIRDAHEADLRDNRILKDRISKGEIHGPRILQAVAIGLPGSYLQEKSLKSRIIMPPIDTSKENGGTLTIPIDASDQQIRDAVDRAIDERGADVIKIGDEAKSVITRKPIPVMTIEQLNSLADQARCRGLQSMMHHSSVDSFRRGVKAGVSSLEHEPFDALLTNKDIEAFKAAGCINNPTISVFYTFFSWKLAGTRTKGHPELDRITDFRDKNYTFDSIADEYFIPELRDDVMNGYKRCASGKTKIMGIIDVSGMYGWDTKTAIAFENVGLLYENDIPMTTANDSLPPCTAAMMNLELCMFDHVLKGKPERKQLSGAEAVKIATINSARSLGLEQEFGAIESGKTADLVIMDGDPLEDFSLIGSRVAALFMDGRLVIDNCGLSVESMMEV